MAAPLDPRLAIAYDGTTGHSSQALVMFTVLSTEFELTAPVNLPVSKTESYTGILSTLISQI
jgi:hypothetical protein